MVTMVTLDDARRVTAAAEQRARSVGQPTNVAVVDAGGIPLRRSDRVGDGVGVSGGSGGQDQEAAGAGAF